MISYKDSGVDIEKSNLFTQILKNTLKSNNIGRFAGIYESEILPDYYFAAATDGIGSKIMPLIQYKMADCIAADLIAMNLNDLICTGASPLFFLDYIAVNNLDVEFTSKVLYSLQKQLEQYNTVLLGGETSELKDLITEKYFDTAGFAIGLVKKDYFLSKNNVHKGDVIIGLCSNGIHANGFTLIRNLFENKLLSYEEFMSTLKPSYIYIKEIEQLVKNKMIKVCANITGGGIKDNLIRVIPQDLCAKVNIKNVPQQDIFKKLENIIGFEESFKTFNIGVGFCLVADKKYVSEIKKICEKYNPFEFGVIKNNDENCNFCFG
ncbi:MAG: phosphoribosylformylglycinamidine cyclo-ligase [Candidatus Gastranaerophilales bacterium]|nr:phosphoribosylformylglycinamidine cyclo-ligase [Candidatus Gastranaerophilales bacterium]